MKTMLTLAILGSTLALAGCNTVNGAGKDVKSAGSTLEKVSGQDDKSK